MISNRHITDSLNVTTIKKMIWAKNKNQRFKEHTALILSAQFIIYYIILQISNVKVLHCTYWPDGSIVEHFISIRWFVRSFIELTIPSIWVLNKNDCGFLYWTIDYWYLAVPLFFFFISFKNISNDEPRLNRKVLIFISNIKKNYKKKFCFH